MSERNEKSAHQATAIPRGCTASLSHGSMCASTIARIILPPRREAKLRYLAHFVEVLGYLGNVLETDPEDLCSLETGTGRYWLSPQGSV